MRLISKYKSFSLTNKILTSCPLKILKFHRTKWKKVQKSLTHCPKNSFSPRGSKLKGSFIFKNKIKLLKFYLFKKNLKQNKSVKSRKVNFIDNLVIKILFKRWFKLNKKYSESLKFKRLISQIFDNSVKNSFFKKELKKNTGKSFDEQFLKVFIKPLFKVNILLTKLLFFKSVYEANQSLGNNRILLNGKFANSNQFLKKGDIITFKKISSKSFSRIFSVLKLNSFFIFFYNFIEIDHYSKTIVILKDYSSLSKEDTHIIYKNYLNLKYFTDYFK